MLSNLPTFLQEQRGDPQYQVIRPGYLSMDASVHRSPVV